MLISASKQRAVADAVESAREAEKDKAIMEAAMYAIPRARELFEKSIEEASLNGSHAVKHILGFNCGSYYNYGYVSKALHEKYGDKHPGSYNWVFGLKGCYNDKPRWKFVHKLWKQMVEELLDDLRENGYEVANIKTLNSKYQNVLKEPNSELLVEHYLNVKW